MSIRNIEAVERLRRFLEDPEWGKDIKIQVRDEYHKARLNMAHYGGNILGARRSALRDGRETPAGPKKDKRSFLKGIGRVDVSKITDREKADQFLAIKRAAQSGDWRDLEFVERLNLWCSLFAQGLQIDLEEDQEPR